MTISSIDGAIAGMKPGWFFFKNTSSTPVVGRPHSFWAVGGIPGAGSYDTTLNGVTLAGGPALSNNLNGQLPFIDPAGGSNSYLARYVAVMGQVGLLMLCDRLWHNGGITAVTSAQAITSPAWPARDANGATLGTGVLVGLEYSATGAANTPTCTLAYTNSIGTTGRTANPSPAISSGAVSQAFYPFTLQAGDVGVRSVQSITFSVAPTAGSCNLVAYRVIAAAEIVTASGPAALDLLTGGMPQIFNGSVMFFVGIPGIAAVMQIQGHVIVTQG
jgi:hypothetical protein